MSKKQFGLTEEQVRASRKQYGSNTLSRKKRKSFLLQFLSSFGDPIIKILLAALAINVLFLFQNADWFEAVGIAVAIFLATFISTLSEYGSESAFLELQNNASNTTCRVQRANGILPLPTSEIVVGDLVLLQAGERIPADGILLSGKLSVDQSAMNGESAEAEKTPQNSRPKKWETDTCNQLFQGCIITAGEGMMEVARVGDNTLYGRMAKDLQEETPESPLKLRLNGLAKTISRLGYIASVLIAFADLFNAFIIDNGFDLAQITADFSHLSVWMPRVLHALTLATAVIVMAVPEGLPMMITVVLSSNMLRMLKDQVMVRKLVGIETSGSMNILFTDKTGTLTKGKLQVVHIIEGDGKTTSKCSPPIKELLQLSALYNTGCVLSKGKPLGGNATDRALLENALPVDSKKYGYTVKNRIPFDSTNKFSFAEISGPQDLNLVKGAPEKLLTHCRYYLDSKGQRQTFSAKTIEDQRLLLSAKAVRMLVIALAPKPIHSEKELCNLTFVAMIGLRDDIRPEVPSAVREVQNAGVQVVMITGDSKETAVAIARDVGLLRSPQDRALTGKELSVMNDQEISALLPHLKVVARALPNDKSRLVQLAQQAGLVAGMTGDGINDAPALKRADVGFAMGSGTEVAKEAGDVVILDDNFASIAKAIRYGRTIFKSIRKFIVYQFTMNLSAVGVSLIGPFIGIDTPVTVIQMLWINIIMDTLAGLAFSGEPPLKEYMKEKPNRKDEPILNKAMAGRIFEMGLYTMGLCLAFLWLPFFRTYFHFQENPIHFLTAFYALFIFSGVFNSFNARTERINPLSNLRKNPLFAVIMIVVCLVQLIMIYYGGRVFRTAGLTMQQLQLIIWMAFSVVPAEMLFKKLRKR
ncbi:MAG: calcium-translocating P-type ATPase, PMCA-type [Clostridia bacterium]|nr:calcium-translocating P-type ATPase, PMCA-type [Clostridia bacterium]